MRWTCAVCEIRRSSSGVGGEGRPTVELASHRTDHNTASPSSYVFSRETVCSSKAREQTSVCASGLEVFERDSDARLQCLFSPNLFPPRQPLSTSKHAAMGLLTIIRKNRFKEKEMRILFLCVRACCCWSCAASS